MSVIHKITRLNRERPVRLIGTSRRSITGRAVVKGISIPFESALERDFLVVLDFDPLVEDVREQPMHIHFQDGRKERYYTPDFLVEYSDGDRMIYEVKYRADLKENWATFKPRFRAAIRYAKAHGMRFSIMTETEIRTPYLTNAKFLRPYRDRVSDAAIEEHLICMLATLGETTPEALLAAAYWHKENRMKALAFLWRMVAIRRVKADLFEPLTMNTPIWVPTGEGFVWQNPHSYQSSQGR